MSAGRCVQVREARGERVKAGGKSVRAVGYTGPNIRALMPELGMRVGVAVTARLDTSTPGAPGGDHTFVRWLRMIEAAAKGTGDGGVPAIGVIECVGPCPPMTVTIGEMMATMMRLAGEGELVSVRYGRILVLDDTNHEQAIVDRAN